MEKNLYIDASHPNETRIVLKSDHSIEEYEFEDKNNLNFKNNIYLATVSRVEPSLQAAFVNFGRIKHGFLAFNDIQSDYYQLPLEDKEKIRIAEEKIRDELKDEALEFNSDSFQSESQSENEKKDIKNAHKLGTRYHSAHAAFLAQKICVVSHAYRRAHSSHYHNDHYSDLHGIWD